MAAGVAQIPWYATLFRGDQFAEAAGARSRRSRCATARPTTSSTATATTMYKFLQCATFESKSDFEAYWYGPEMNDFRTIYSGWYQVPILYTWADVIVQGGRNGVPEPVKRA